MGQWSSNKDRFIMSNISFSLISKINNHFKVFNAAFCLGIVIYGVFAVKSGNQDLLHFRSGDLSPYSDLPITPQHFTLFPGWLILITWTSHEPGGRDCFNFSAFSRSWMTRVYKYLLHRTLNLTLSLFFLIFTAVKGNLWQLNLEKIWTNSPRLMEGNRSPSTPDSEEKFTESASAVWEYPQINGF